MITRMLTFAILAATGLLCGCADSLTPETTPSAEAAAVTSDTALQPDAASIYAVADYDPQRDAADDLTAAVQQASASGKRILLEIGGQW